MAKKYGIRIRARAKDGEVTVKSILSHPMQNGQRKNKKTGKKYPANFIKEIVARVGDIIVMKAFFGDTISKNPYLSFKYNGEKNQRLTLSWVDSRGRSATETIRVK